MPDPACSLFVVLGVTVLVRAVVNHFSFVSLLLNWHQLVLEAVFKVRLLAAD